MVGIRETIDLDITAAMAKVRELESVVNRIGHVNVGGTGSTGLASVTTDAKAAETGVAKLLGTVGLTRAELGAFASTAAGSVSPALGQMGGLVSGLSEKLAGPAGIAVAAAAVGLALGEMALHGVKEVLELAGAIRTVQRATGATAEDASRLVAVGKALGVSAETEASAFFRLSQNLRNRSEALQADGVVVARSADGHINLSKTLLSVADAYHNAGKGAEGNRVLFDAFGRSGLALAPILSKSREELEEFYAAAARHHEIFSQGDLDKAYAYKIAQHDLTEAFSGLERELGLAVIPALTSFAHGLTSIIETVDKIGDIAGKITAPFGGLGRTLGGLAKDSFPEVAFAVDLARGHFVGALTDLVPYGNTLHNLFFRHSDAAAAAEKHAEAERKVDDAFLGLAASSGVSEERLRRLAQTLGIDLATGGDKATKALSEAAASISGAVTPTERLAAANDVLSRSDSTAAENVKAFKEALDATVGVSLSAAEATIGVRSAVTKLAEELAKGKQASETAIGFQDRLTTAGFAVVKAIEAEGKALADSGQLAQGPAAQLDFLRQRLNEAADATPALRDEVQQLIAQLGLVRSPPSVMIDVDVTHALYKLGLVNYAMSPKAMAGTANAYNSIGAQQQAAGWDALGGAPSIPSPFGDLAAAASAGAKAGHAAAAAAVKEVETTLRASAGPGGGLDLGEFIVAGIDISGGEAKVRVNNFMLSLIDGMRDVVASAEKIDPAEQLGILEAVQAADKAAKDLGETRAKLGANSIEAAIAEGRLHEAQAKVNEVTLDALDATKAVAAAQKAQEDETKRLRDAQEALTKSMNDGLNTQLAALSAARGLVAAQRALRDAQRSLTELQARQTAIPSEIAAAEAVLAAARARAAATTTDEALAVVNARQRVKAAEETLRATQANSAATGDDLLLATLEVTKAHEDLAAATAATTGPTSDVTEAERTLADLRKEQADVADNLTDATSRVTDAQLGLVDSQRKLVDAGKDLIDQKAGFEDFFRSLASQAGLSAQAVDALIASMRQAAGLAGSAAGTGQYGGYSTFDEFFSHQNPADQEGLLNLGRVNVPAVAPMGFAAQGATTYNVRIYPKQAVFDERSMLETFGTLELMQR